MCLRRLLFGTLLLAAAGCAPEPTSPQQASERWLRLETEHFDLATDLAPADAQVAAESLEKTRHALFEAAWTRADDRLTERTTVVVFREKLDYDHYQPKTIGLYTWAVRPTIFLYGLPDHWSQRTALSDESSTSVLRHELTHRLAAGVYGRQPRWFAEGLAQFLETTTLSADGKTATLGRVNLVALRKYHACREATAAEVLAWRADTSNDARLTCALYGMSFLLVHYLYNQKAQELAVYQTKLAKGVEPERAFTESFPDIVVATLDKELNQYSNYGKFTELERPVSDLQVSTAPAAITAADVLAIRAQLAFVSGKADEARADTTQALALESGNTLALCVMRVQTHDWPVDTLVRLQGQVARRPDDAGAWHQLGLLSPAGAREAPLRKAMALEPRSADYVSSVARELTQTGHADAALPLATKAALLAPWSSSIVDTYATTLYGVGRCPDALVTERRALDLLAERANRAEAAPLQAKIAEYEKACP